MSHASSTRTTIGLDGLGWLNVFPGTGLVSAAKVRLSDRGRATENDSHEIAQNV
jgi:hypothetical protein